MLCNNEYPEPEIFTETYSVVNMKADKRCRGDNPVIGKIEKILNKVCTFSRFGVNLREVCDGDDFFYKYCDARMLSEICPGYLVPIQLRLKGKYLLDDIRVSDLGIGEKCEHSGVFDGEVEVKLKYDDRAEADDVEMVRNALRSSGLEKE